ncbi:MAG: hypothetical protein AAGD01_02565 [Acidobacteriota bacterium]
MRVLCSAPWLRLAFVLAVTVTAVGLLAPAAQAAYPNCWQICNYSPPSANCTCWFPGGYYHPGCAQYQITGCFPGRSAPAMSPSVLSMSSLEFASPELSKAAFLLQLDEGFLAVEEPRDSAARLDQGAKAVEGDEQGGAVSASASDAGDR